jgi:hypothetical protein
MLQRIPALTPSATARRPDPLATAHPPEAFRQCLPSSIRARVLSTFFFKRTKLFLIILFTNPRPRPLN